MFTDINVFSMFSKFLKSTAWVLSITPKIPEISVGIQMEKSVSVSSDRNFRITSGGGPLILVGIFRPKLFVPFLTNRFFALIRDSGRGTNVVKAIPIGWPGLIGKCRFILFRNSH